MHTGRLAIGRSVEFLTVATVSGQTIVIIGFLGYATKRQRSRRCYPPPADERRSAFGDSGPPRFTETKVGALAPAR
jgi:hypothetical protein